MGSIISYNLVEYIIFAVCDTRAALCREPFSGYIIAPFAPSLPPSGAYGAYDTLELPVQKFISLFRTGNAALSQLGSLSGGAKPPGSVTVIT